VRISLNRKTTETRRRSFRLYSFSLIFENPDDSLKIKEKRINVKRPVGAMTARQLVFHLFEIGSEFKKFVKIGVKRVASHLFLGKVQE
jgi:hypothetical protein